MNVYIKFIKFNVLLIKFYEKYIKFHKFLNENEKYIKFYVYVHKYTFQL